MAEWTETAEAAFAQYAAVLRETVAGTEADPEEVIEDTRRHVEAALEEAGVTVVVGSDVERVLGAMGGLDPAPFPATATGPADANSRPPAAPPGGGGAESGRLRLAARIATAALIGTFGIALPVITLIVEAVTGVCANLLFDPIPTWWHVLLVASVPIVNTWALVAVLYGRTRFPRALSVANAATIAIALYYALAFLPVTPFAIIGVLYMGVGLLPLSPFLSAICGGGLRVQLHRQGPSRPRFRVRSVDFVAGLGLTLVALMALELPRTLTTVGLHLAASEKPETATTGVRFLRTFGSERQLLEACYAARGVNADLVSVAMRTITSEVGTTESRAIYYRVTGIPFNGVKRPGTRWGGGDRDSLFVGDFDLDLGGDVVAGRARDLYLVESRLDVSVDPEACLSYTEWIMVFRNDGVGQEQEARMGIRLPTGGVVTRVTLWVDGEEREAAFAGRSAVKEAYKSVVRRRQDPLLVTTDGRDAVLAQCYPVPAGGGTMKIRVGITAPLRLSALDSGILWLPSLGERNFVVADGLEHHVWVESDRALKLATGAGQGLVPEMAGPDLYALRGGIANPDLTRGIGIAAARSPELTRAWTHDARAEAFVTQRIEAESPPPPSRLVVVVDASTSMAPFVEAIIGQLERLPKGVDVRFLVVDDAVTVLGEAAGLADQSRARRDWFAGGFDNVPALLRARRLAAEIPGGKVLWLHGPQPIPFTPLEGLRQDLERRPDPAGILHISFAGGADFISTDLAASRAFAAAPHVGGPVDDLAALVSRWCGDRQSFRFDRETQDEPPAAAANLTETSLHLARLWALDAIHAELTKGQDADRERCLALAASYHLVTPISGAVVLESKAQYDEAGLQPVPEGEVPTIPEPEIWVLMVVAGAVLIGVQLVKWYRHGFPSIAVGS